MFFLRVKNFITTGLAGLLALFTLLFAQGLQVSRFSSMEGERTFYLKSPSSQAKMKESFSPLEMFLIKGESVVFFCENREKTLAKIMEEYAATLLFEECAGGSISYYCFTPKWADGIALNGVFVNLHVAFNGEHCAVGTPLIFGSF
jgi:hypothetical protein